MAVSQSSSVTVTSEPKCSCPHPSAMAVASLEAKVGRVEQWLLQDLRHARAERRLLETVIHIKEEDLEYHQQRLVGLQKQVARLERELIECRWDLMQCRRQHRKIYADNVRLQGDNSKLHVLIAQLKPYNLKQVDNSWVRYCDTAL